MKSIDVLNWRYATKKFDSSEYLSEEKINILKEAFNLTPTSYGLQPLRLLVVKDKNLQEKLKAASYNQQQVHSASHVLVICIETNLNEQFIKNNFDLVKKIRNTPDEVLTPYQNFLIDDFSKRTTEQVEQWATNQAYLVLGNLLTICAYEEIDACPMEGFVADKYAEILNLNEKNLKPVLVLPVGKRANDDMFAEFKKVRRPLEEMVIDVIDN